MRAGKSGVDLKKKDNFGVVRYLRAHSAVVLIMFVLNTALLLSVIYHRCLCPVPSKCVRKRPEVSVFYAVGFFFRFSAFHAILSGKDSSFRYGKFI